MNFWQRMVQWFRTRWAPAPIERTVAHLPAPVNAPRDERGRTADAPREVIRTEGVLKPEHLRKIVRDPRLLPKPRKRWDEKRVPVMSVGEARRRFSASLRTSRRDIVDLDADEAQLARYGLPVWRTEADLARELGIEERTLRSFASHRVRDRISHYVTFAIRKRRGGHRVIQAPRRRLKAVQRTLLATLCARLPVSESAHGFRTGRSVRTNALPHVGHRVLLTMDLADFFPTITHARVRGLFIAYGYSYTVASTLALLVTEPARQLVEADGGRFFVPVGPRVCVQGAPTSPAISNAIVKRLDHRLSALAKKYGFTFTRYADDLSFSGNDTKSVLRLRALVPRIVKEEGFVVNDAKTRIHRRGGPMRVTGAMVNDVLGLSRKERRKIRAAIHAESHGRLDARERTRLDGHIAWVRSLNPAQADALVRKRGERRATR